MQSELELHSKLTWLPVAQQLYESLLQTVHWPSQQAALAQESAPWSVVPAETVLPAEDKPFNYTPSPPDCIMPDFFVEAKCAIQVCVAVTASMQACN